MSFIWENARSLKTEVGGKLRTRSTRQRIEETPWSTVALLTSSHDKDWRSFLYLTIKLNILSHIIVTYSIQNECYEGVKKYCLYYLVYKTDFKWWNWSIISDSSAVNLFLKCFTKVSTLASPNASIKYIKYKCIFKQTKLCNKIKITIQLQNSY